MSMGQALAVVPASMAPGVHDTAGWLPQTKRAAFFFRFGNLTYR